MDSRQFDNTDQLILSATQGIIVFNTVFNTDALCYVVIYPVQG